MTCFMGERRAALFLQYDAEDKCVKSLAGTRAPMKSDRRPTAEPGVWWAELLLAPVALTHAVLMPSAEGRCFVSEFLVHFCQTPC